MGYDVVRFYTSDGGYDWVPAGGYVPKVGDVLSLPRQYFPSLYSTTDSYDGEHWEVERVLHRFDNNNYIGANVHIRKIEYKRV